MAFLSLLPLRVLFSHFVHSAITGVILSVCLFLNAAIIPTPTQTVPIPLVTSDEEASANTPPSPQGALYLQQPPKEKAVEGEDVVFPCLLKSDVDEEAAVEKVSWYVYSSKGRRNVLQDNETLEDAFAGRVFLSGDVSMGDLSMTLRNVSVEDQGLYLCVFILTNSTVLQGGGTKLSIRKEWVRVGEGVQNNGVIEESVGTIIGIVVAAVGVALGLVAVILSAEVTRAAAMDYGC